MSHTVRRPRELDDKAEEKARRKKRVEAEKCPVCGLLISTHLSRELRACRRKVRR